MALEEFVPDPPETLALREPRVRSIFDKDLMKKSIKDV
jgi:hypothetical protein